MAMTYTIHTSRSPIPYRPSVISSHLISLIFALKTNEFQLYICFVQHCALFYAVGFEVAREILFTFLQTWNFWRFATFYSRNFRTNLLKVDGCYLEGCSRNFFLLWMCAAFNRFYRGSFFVVLSDSRTQEAWKRTVTIIKSKAGVLGASSDFLPGGPLLFLTFLSLCCFGIS